MRAIENYKSFILDRVKDIPNIKINKIAHDTNFLLYCFRSQRYVDKRFTTQLSNDFVKNLNRLNDDIDKTRLINTISQLHLKSGFKIEKVTANEIAMHINNINKIPSMRWLLDIMTVFCRSGHTTNSYNILIERLNKLYLEQDYKEKENIPLEDLLKICWNLWYSKTKNINIWSLLIQDLYKKTMYLNTSQISIIMKIIANIKLIPMLDQTYLKSTLIPFINDMISRVFILKEQISSNEAISILRSLNELNLLDDATLQKFEQNILHEKISYITLDKIILLMRIYSNRSKENNNSNNKLRLDIMDKLQKILIKKLTSNLANPLIATNIESSRSKLGKDLTLKESMNYQLLFQKFLNENLLTNNEYNQLFINFIVQNKFESFKNFLFAKVIHLNFTQINNFCFILQGLIIRNINKISFENIYKAMQLFSFRSEISKSFHEQVMFYIQKSIMNMQSSKKLSNINVDGSMGNVRFNPKRERFFMAMIKLMFGELSSGKIDKDVSENSDELNNQEANQRKKISKELLQSIKSCTNNKSNMIISFYEIIKNLSIVTLEQLSAEFWTEFINIIHKNFDGLSDDEILCLLSAQWNSIIKVNNPELNDQIKDWLIESYITFSPSQLCIAYPHLINQNLSSNIIENFNIKLKNSKLSLYDYEILTRSSPSLSKDLKEHIEQVLPILIKSGNVADMDYIINIVMNCFKHCNEYEYPFLNQLIQAISMKNQFLNQKILEKLINSFSEIRKLQGNKA